MVVSVRFALAPSEAGLLSSLLFWFLAPLFRFPESRGATCVCVCVCVCVRACVRACAIFFIIVIIINNNRRLVTLAEHTSDHGKQTNSSTEEKGEQG